MNNVFLYLLKLTFEFIDEPIIVLHISFVLLLTTCLLLQQPFIFLLQDS